MRTDKKHPQKADKNTPSRVQKRGIVGYSKKSALLEEAITHMNTGKYGRSSAALKDLLSLDPHNTEARRLFATLHLRLGSLATARQAFESLANEAIGRQDFWLAESLLREYLAAGPRCVPFLELLAHVYEEKGDAVAAVAELGKAIDILIEDPDSENPKKPSRLYAKVRELAPVSSVACQFASLFDIQTGAFVHSSMVCARDVIGNRGLAAPGQTLAKLRTQGFVVMPGEQFRGGSSSQETTPHSVRISHRMMDVAGVLIDRHRSVGYTGNGRYDSNKGQIQEANDSSGMSPSILGEPPFRRIASFDGWGSRWSNLRPLCVRGLPILRGATADVGEAIKPHTDRLISLPWPGSNRA